MKALLFLGSEDNKVMSDCAFEMPAQPQFKVLNKGSTVQLLHLTVWHRYRALPRALYMMAAAWVAR